MNEILKDVMTVAFARFRLMSGERERKSSSTSSREFFYPRLQMWCKKNYVRNNEPLTVIFNGKTREYLFYYCLQCDKPTMPFATAVDFQIPASPLLAVPPIKSYSMNTSSLSYEPLLKFHI